MRDTFFPRDDELSEIFRGLDSTRCVTLVGPGGAGKTRLAREYVERMDIASYWFVALAARDAGVGEAVCDAVGVADQDALDQLLSHLDAPMLVLDNVEQLRDEAAVWTSQMLDAHPTMRVLVSSREALHIRGETLVQVGPLPNEVAVAMFVDRARERGARMSLDEARPLVDRIGGLPLVLELAAGRTRTMGPDQILERLETQGLSLLSAAAPDRDARHRSVHALVEHSWRLLDERSQQALAECSAFRGDFDLAAAEAVLTAGAGAWQVLDGLVEKSLIEPVDDRFLLLEPVRMFAMAQLNDADAVFRRHAEHYAALGQVDGVGRCPRRDLNNLLAAHYRMAPQDLTLTARLTRSAEYALRLRSAAEQMESLADSALRLHPRVGDDEQWARGALLRCRAVARLGRHDHAPALDDARAAVAIADELDHDQLRADALPVLAWLLTEIADDGALETAFRGVEVADRCGVAELQTFARIAAGLALISNGQWDDARRVVERGVEIATAADETRLAGWLYILLGQAQERCASLEVALTCYELAEACAIEVGDGTWISISRFNIGAAKQALGDLAGARHGFAASLEAARSVGDRHAESQALMGLGRAQVAFGESPRESFHSAIDALAGLEVWYERGIAYSALGIWEIGRHPAVAEDVFRIAAEHVSRMDDHAWAGMMHAYRACAAALAGRPWRAFIDDAATAWNHAPQYARDLDFAERACLAFEQGTTPAWDDDATSRAEELDAHPKKRLQWLHDNHVRTWLTLGASPDSPRPRLTLEDEARVITLPDGEVQDFGRRGPLRRMLLALGQHAVDQPGECLTVEDLLEATYPDEQMTFESGRMRIHTSVRRLRREGFQELLLTRDDGYLLDPEAEIVVR